jgi:hypothetical protein
VTLAPAVLLALLVAAPPAPQRGKDGNARQEDPVADIGRWTEDFRRNGPDVGVDRMQELERLVADLRMLEIAAPDRRNEIVLALLDLAGVRSNKELRARRVQSLDWASVGRQTDRVQERGREVLEGILASDREGLAAWLATDVLARPGSNPAERRIAALELLTGQYVPSTKLALFASAIDEDREVRDAAMNALVGWPDEGVHRFMLQQLARAEEDRAYISREAVRRHFKQVTIDAGSDSERALLESCSRRMLSEDWREAFRGIQLQMAVQDDPAVPALIEGLSVWIDRRERGNGSRRIEHELLRELERRSGRRIGLHPQRWSAWWKLQSSGQLVEQPGDAPERRTKAEFFGLRPVTDRVVFVIDASGSMTTPFGPVGNTRYGEAVDQMLDFLRELGPKARFRVVLFSSELDVWQQRLQPATESNLKSAQRWLLYHQPKGGTFIRPAIEHVLRLDKQGEVDLDRLEADSVIVLCDGDTAEGPGWIGPLLARANDDACLAFHCVQIGSGGDGSLEALAADSGGDFVHVAE